MKIYHWRMVAATTTGIALIAVETILNLSYVSSLSSLGQWAAWLEQPLLLAIVIAGVAQAVAAVITSATWRARRMVICGLSMIGLISAIAFTFSTTYERTLSTREARVLSRDGDNMHIRSAAARVKDLAQRKNDECATRGPQCRAIEGELMEARAVLAGYGRQVTADQLGRMGIIPDLALPIMMLVLGLAFIAYAEGDEVSPFVAPAPAARQPEPISQIPVDDPVIVALRKNPDGLSNLGLARAMGCSPGEATKRRQILADRLSVNRDGRHLRIRIA